VSTARSVTLTQTDGQQLATRGVVESCPLVSSDGCFWPKPNGALVLGPNDKLVVSLPRGATLDALDQLEAHLRDLLGDRVVVVGGAEQIAALQSEVSS
jgi:hypothetical protein